MIYFFYLLLQQITVYVISTTVLIFRAIFVAATCGYCSDLIISEKKGVVLCVY